MNPLRWWKAYDMAAPSIDSQTLSEQILSGGGLDEKQIQDWWVFEEGLISRARSIGATGGWLIGFLFVMELATVATSLLAWSVGLLGALALVPTLEWAITTSWLGWVEPLRKIDAYEGWRGRLWAGARDLRHGECRPNNPFSNWVFDQSATADDIDSELLLATVAGAEHHHIIAAALSRGYITTFEAMVYLEETGPAGTSLVDSDPCAELKVRVRSIVRGS